MNLIRLAIVSEAEFLSLPETMDRAELLDGELVVAPSPAARHQTLLVRLVAALETWARTDDSPVFVSLAPLDVRIAPGRILQLDAFVVLAEVATEQDSHQDVIPDLCVEVLSTNRAYDRLTKRVVYATAGVRELWIVEPSGLIERWFGPGLNEAEELTGVLHSTLLPGFELNLTTLFRRKQLQPQSPSSLQPRLEPRHGSIPSDQAADDRPGERRCLLAVPSARGVRVETPAGRRVPIATRTARTIALPRAASTPPLGTSPEGAVRETIAPRHTAAKSVSVRTLRTVKAFCKVTAENQHQAQWHRGTHVAQQPRREEVPGSV